MRLSVSALAAHLRVSRKTLSKIVNERGSITPDMAQRLGRAFNTGPELWLNLQQNRDLWDSEHTPGDWEKVEPLPGLTTSEQAQVGLCSLVCNVAQWETFTGSRDRGGGLWTACFL